MKACVLHAIGDLRVEEKPVPEPAKGQVLVRVAACGVCGSDIPRIFEKGTYRFPLIPGHEFAGTVEKIGEDVEPSWGGRRVAVFPLIPCTHCEMCTAGAYAQCSDYDYLGSRCDGAFAEYVTAPAWNLVPVPESLSLEEAAMCEPAAVASHALCRAEMTAGQSVAIFGAGPIGLMLAQWANAWKAAKVMLLDVDPEKLKFAQSLGYENVHNPKDSDSVEWVKHQTKTGADIVIEGSGSSVAFEQTVQCAKPFGAVVLMGNPVGPMTLSQKAYWSILRNELRVLGTWNSSFSELRGNEWRMSLEAMESGLINVKPLISHRTGPENLLEHLIMMRDRKGFFNKVMMINS